MDTYVTCGVSVGYNTRVNPGIQWDMEVDLRSSVPEQRTLHWFVDGKQQDVFVTHLPQSVEFGVWFLLSFHSILITISLSPHQICTFAKGDSLQFISLEKLTQPRVRPLSTASPNPWTASPSLVSYGVIFPETHLMTRRNNFILHHGAKGFSSAFVGPPLTSVCIAFVFTSFPSFSSSLQGIHHMFLLLLLLLLLLFAYSLLHFFS